MRKCRPAQPRDLAFDMDSTLAGAQIHRLQEVSKELS
jgi:hypothetical protein